MQLYMYENDALREIPKCNRAEPGMMFLDAADEEEYSLSKVAVDKASRFLPTVAFILVVLCCIFKLSLTDGRFRNSGTMLTFLVIVVTTTGLMSYVKSSYAAYVRLSRITSRGRPCYANINEENEGRTQQKTILHS